MSERAGGHAQATRPRLTGPAGSAGLIGSADRVTEQVTRRVLRARPSRGGAVVGLLFFCASLTPTLLPRSWFAQSLISGVSTTTGYAIGVVLGWGCTRVVPRRLLPAPPVRRVVVRVALTLAGLLVVVSLQAGWGWQRDLYVLMGEDPPARWEYLRVPGAALLVVVGLVSLVRLVRRGVSRLIGLIRRALPPGPQELLGVTAGLLVLVGVAEGVALGGFLSAANGISAMVNDAQSSSVPAPTSTLRSGGPGSLVSFASLGREGRTFVSGGPTLADLRRFDGPQVKEPIRVYVGLRSTGSTDRAADLAVRELERTGAFDRSTLCVVTTTGTGWVDPYLSDALEYLHHGDTAIVGVQYSFLPSWISFLSERDRVAAAGPQLFDAVYDHWATLPANHRPRLVVFGESLGSLGSEAGFTDLDDVRARTQGVIWAGPTNANPLWSRLVRDRDPGSREVLPVYEEGRTVRFASRPEDLAAPSGVWSQPRVVYLQNPSDPVTWWSPDLLWHRPDWLTERRGRDLLPAMRWYPVVTFLQVSADLALAYGAPPGHGHRFHQAAVDAWAAIDTPPGWTTADTVRLADLLGP